MKTFAYELTYDFPNDLILEILKNYKILENPKIWVGT